MKYQQNEKVNSQSSSRQLSSSELSIDNVLTSHTQSATERVFVRSVTTNVVYFGDGYPNLYAIDILKGSVAWSIFIGMMMYSYDAYNIQYQTISD